MDRPPDGKGTDRVMRALSGLRRLAELFVGALMALMFLTFVLQITIRYTARLEWIGEALYRQAMTEAFGRALAG